MMQLMALALNPHLSEAEFVALSDQAMKNEIKLFTTATECMKKLPQEDRMQYAMLVLPLLVAL